MWSSTTSIPATAPVSTSWAIAAASEPAPGSEMLIDMTSPEQIAPRAAFFCSSLAKRL